MTVLLETVNVTRLFPSGRGIANISMRVPAGAIYVLCGPNGAGKTTLLRSLVGLWRPTSGVIRWRGEDLPLNRHVPRRGLGFLPDTPFTDANLTAIQWAEFVSGIKGVPMHEDAALTRANAFELSAGVLQRPIRELSFGTQRKIALWTELITTSHLLVLDEPFSGLDPVAIDALHDSLRSYVSDGKSVLFSTHLLREVGALATHVAVLIDGGMRYEGTAPGALGEGGVLELFRATVAESARA